mmetsp:Transcript_1110/g.1902  ORF Transcript_1110/g.1902 Transcript_1110/m.1902 type:complete len:226 (-) Transcript_1110:139-816(-)
MLVLVGCWVTINARKAAAAAGAAVKWLAGVTSTRRANLRSAGTSRHDDLIHFQNCARRVGGQHQRRAFGGEQVPHAFRCHVANGALVDINALRQRLTDAWLAVLRRRVGFRFVCRVQIGNDRRRVEAARLGERGRHHFERLGEALHGVLLKAGRVLGQLGEAARQLDLARTAAHHKARITSHGFEHVDGVVDGALHVVEDVARGATHQQRCYARFALFVGAKVRH